MTSQEKSATKSFRWLGWVVTIALPFALVLTAVRLLLTPAYVQIEYRTPNFPADRYGFDLEDRLKWSKPSLEYLLNDEGIEYLGDLKFDDGTPIYNQRELKHMLDVKIVVQAVLWVWWITLAFVILPGLFAWRTGQISAYKAALRRGVFFTLGFLGIILVAMVVSFGVFFVFFHDVFFDPGTWTFLYSDTLIRLFPERFWRDTFLWVAGIAGFIGVVILFFTRKKS